MTRKPRAGSTALDRIVDPISVGSDGSIQISTAKLAAPQNVYDADYAWVQRRQGAVSLFFGKSSIDDSGKLRTRLELRYPREAFLNHLWKNSRNFHQKLREFLGQCPTDRSRDSINPAGMKADRDHSDWVNVDYIAHSGTQACLDFFNLSPPGVARLLNKQGSTSLVLAPVVRVQTTAAELCRLLDSCGVIADEIQAENVCWGGAGTMSGFYDADFFEAAVLSPAGPEALDRAKAPPFLTWVLPKARMVAAFAVAATLSVGPAFDSSPCFRYSERAVNEAQESSRFVGPSVRIRLDGTSRARSSWPTPELGAEEVPLAPTEMGLFVE